MSVKVKTVLGGSDDRWEYSKEKESFHIVVGTPGKVLNMIKRSFRLLNRNHLKYCFIDMMDKIIQNGLKEQVKGIFELIPADI